MTRHVDDMDDYGGIPSDEELLWYYKHEARENDQRLVVANQRIAELEAENAKLLDEWDKLREFTATCRQPVTCAQEAQRESAYYIPHQCRRCGWRYRKVKGNEDEQK